MQHFKKIVIFLLLMMFTSLWAEPIGRLYDPQGDVKIIHNNKIFTAFNRFRLYKKDIVVLNDKNSTALLHIFENGSILYPLKGKTSIPVNQYILLKKTRF